MTVMYIQSRPSRSNANVHSFNCHVCNDEYSLFFEEQYYSADELIEMVLELSAMEFEKARVQKNGLLYCGYCKPKGTKIFEFKLINQYEPMVGQKEKPTDSTM